MFLAESRRVADSVVSLQAALSVNLLVQNNTLAAFVCPNGLYFSSFVNNFNFAKVANFLAKFL